MRARRFEVIGRVSMSFDLVINGKTVKANRGETLVDAGLSGWVAIPHDCCSGQCETCRVTVVSGQVDDQGTADKRTVLACQAKVIGNAAIAFEHVAEVTKRSGLVTGISQLASDIVEVAVLLDTPVTMRPGQYLSVKFAGFPARDLSPTVRFDGSAAPGELIFHIRRYPGGLVSTQIGATIKPGHRVQVRGPFGGAFLREGDGPIVLIGGGTGWAPIWSVAAAARREQRHRELIVIAGSRDAEGLYMRRSLDWLRDDGVREVIATAETGAVNPVMRGRPTHYLPSLGPEDTVFVAGPPPLVDAVKRKSRRPRRVAMPIRSCRTHSRCRSSTASWPCCADLRRPRSRCPAPSCPPLPFRAGGWSLPLLPRSRRCRLRRRGARRQPRAG